MKNPCSISSPSGSRRGIGLRSVVLEAACLVPWFFRGGFGRWLLLLALAGLIPGGLRSVSAAEIFTSAFISEVLAVNPRGLKDEDGDRPGWIEIHNGGQSKLSLAGWFLTDSPENPTKWRFPNVEISPDKDLLVFVSGKNRTNNLTPLHANFRLESRWGYLALFGRRTNLVSALRPSQPLPNEGVAIGRVRGEPALVGPMLRPTPGRHNSSSGPGFASEVGFSKPGGNFVDPLTVELYGGATNVVIRYTLDGTLPHSRSPVYLGPLAVTNSVIVRARAYQDGLLPGPPRGEAYLHVSTNAVGFSSSLPVLVMETFGKDTLVSAQRSFVHLSLHEPVGGRTSLTNAPTLAARAGLRVRGSTSASMPQQSFAVSFLDEFNEEISVPLLGLPAESDWTLYAPNWFDPVMIHNPFVHQLSRDMGRYSPRTRFVEVFLVRSAGAVRDVHYHGVYVLQEKIKIAKHRVAIDKAGADDLKPPDITGGYLLKFDRLGPGEEGLNVAGVGMVFVEPKEGLMTLPQRAPQMKYLRSFFDDFDSALHGPNWRDPRKGYPAFLDVEAAIDFHVLEVLSGNVDAMLLSTHFYKPRNGKITFGPHWDFDRALGSTDGRDENPRYWNTGPFFSGAWWPRLFSDPDFWQRWVDRWQELRQSHFSTTNLHGLVDRLCAELKEAQPRQYKRWDMQPRGGSYQGEISLMKKWLSNRVDFIDGQLTQPPRFNREGGRVAPGFLLTLSLPTNSTNATVYYTLDGSDPRLSQGAVSSNALAYVEPIALRSNCVITARAWNPKQRQTDGPPVSTPWSGRVTAKFEVVRP